MARPRTALISKRRALEVALEIIDKEGIEALSIRHLADRLKINGATLYHHFENKEEIIVGAARLALEAVRTPQSPDEPWRVWLMRNVRNLRQAFRDHPDLVPVMLGRQPLGIGAAQLDATVALLWAENVPVGAIAPMLEALELYAIGSALHEARRGMSTEVVDAAATPYLTDAAARSALTPDELFDLVCERIIDSVVLAAVERAGSTQAPPIPNPAPQPHVPPQVPAPAVVPPRDGTRASA
ncbi:hypothetical protein GCM10023321_60330 [Pseudonocardia eucalypti]|uniref:HTH tetR-type domain-containing protein n=1 Tax=Pseudonocardia eucalypti TaxID=648755 RepID=A0ABP9QUQ1_9PSEU|nr:AcrR family transcriptional regulator [Pseudonocardia eucalypti]